MSNFEDVDRHVNSLSLPAVGTAVTPAQLCTYYKAAEPILKLLVGLPLIPANWKNVLNGLLGVLDKICP